MSCQANCPYILAVLTLIVFIDFHPYRPNSLVCSTRATQILLNQPCCSWLGKKYYFTIMHESDFVTDKGQRTTVMTLAATAQSQCPRASSHQMPQGTDDVRKQITTTCLGIICTCARRRRCVLQWGDLLYTRDLHLHWNQISFDEIHCRISQKKRCYHPLYEVFGRQLPVARTNLPICF